MNILKNSAVSLVSELRHGRISATQLLEITIKQAERIANNVNPFAVHLHEQARVAAKNADEQIAAGSGGPLCGLPITIKDSQWMAGIPCANGSGTQKDFIPEQTCKAVERLQSSGAVIFAKTTCPEFSLMGITDSSLYGRTSNPWNTSYTCGGSSGGAGAAVSAGAGSLSLGGDGGGSIRIPAAFCGIVGFKPSFRAVPREPCFPSWSTLVSYGPMARNVADARLMFSAMVDNDCEHRYLDTLQQHANSPDCVQGRKIIVSEDLGFALVDPSVRLRFRDTIKRLESAGAELIYDHPHLPSSVITWATSAHYDSWSHQKQKQTPLDGLHHSTVQMMEFGLSLTDKEFEAAETHRLTIKKAYLDMFERTGSSIFITPTLGCEAFEHGTRHPKSIESTMISYPWLDWAPFLYDANLVGMPACAVPMGLGDNNLPVSIQVSGPVGSDASVLDVSEHLETLISWDRYPDIF